MRTLLAEADLSYSDAPPVLVIGSSPAARDRAVRTVHHSGFRIAGPFDLEEGAERLKLQGLASAIWLELDDEPPTLPACLERAAEVLKSHRFGAIVSTMTVAQVEPVMAHFPSADVEYVVGSDDAERASALAMATSAFQPFAVRDVASDQNNTRLRQLSDEVSRIAATLARLSTGPGQPAPAQEPPPVGDVPDISVDTVRAVIRARRVRSRYFSEELFADPAWDMLLDLLQAEIAQLRVPVSSLCIAAAVPATTALRWLKTMTSQGIFVRRADPHDGRRVFVELDPKASAALRRYFAEVGKPAVI